MSSAQTLGAHLRRYRERSGQSVEAVSAGSRIVPRLVDALEADRQDLLPAPVYVRGFIRAYCDQVGADAEEALRLYEVRAIEATWVRIQPDGGEPTEETLAPGAVREWRSTGRFRVTLGNAGGVELELDGQALPALGERGRVVRDVIVPSGAGS